MKFIKKKKKMLEHQSFMAHPKNFYVWGKRERERDERIEKKLGGCTAQKIEN